MEANKSTRTQRTDQEIFQLMEDFEKSDNLSIAEFCEIYEISNATFYNWQKRYRSRNEKSSSGFLSIDVVPSPADSTELSLFAEVRGIKLYREVSASYLKELAL